MGDGQRAAGDDQDGARAPNAWRDAFAAATAPALALIWLISLCGAPVPPAVAVGLYGAVFAALLPVLRPWAARRD